MQEMKPILAKENPSVKLEIEQTLAELVYNLSVKEDETSRAQSLCELAGTEDVVLQHVESPECFFLMRTKEWQLANSLRLDIQKEWEEGDVGKVQMSDIAVVKLEQSEEFHRVKIITEDYSRYKHFSRFLSQLFDISKEDFKPLNNQISNSIEAESVEATEHKAELVKCYEGWSGVQRV